MKKLNLLVIISVFVLASCNETKNLDPLENNNTWTIQITQTWNTDEKVSTWENDIENQNPEKLDWWNTTEDISQDYDINNLEVWAKIWNMVLWEKREEVDSLSFRLDWNTKIKWELSGYYDEMQESDVIFFEPEKSDYFRFQTRIWEHKVELFYSQIANPHLIDENDKKELLNWKKYKVELDVIEYVYVWWFESEESYETTISAYKILD